MKYHVVNSGLEGKLRCKGFCKEVDEGIPFKLLELRLADEADLPIGRPDSRSYFLIIFLFKLDIIISLFSKNLVIFK